MDNARNRIVWAVVIPQIVILAISILWICVFPQDNVAKYFRFDLSVLLGGILTGIGLALAGYCFYLFAKKTGKFSSAVELFEKILSPSFITLKPIDIIVLSLIAGFSEEVFFRGLLNQRFGIVLSSLAFGLLHLPGKKYWIYAVWATMSGALFAYLLMVTGSIWLPIIAHGLNNLIGMFLLKTLQRLRK